ncbi:hypothetical protein A7X95_02405 [Candidatus Nitrosopelagicus brevis]|uniref:RNase H type-1 domain-containing protein n=1 Tax=Candidatus Nitrosopelagicus brevis TaxID=1410606 RepID=A0A0A7V279_9ARCH|nr:hypothetical protein [Candidatus Nitrosopelagicus brevis]AJA93144.1 hypothetical protein T478_0909 [Candidatus Nitrosopelagicus brevis]PTL88142.1 hypothetical protein A7X95_02405 [Candidatus Nitrosopelagicus brevis]|tara:strand:+ start:37 stop:477 length:441 start_codon:yes stop_codon:yes gene_type:complete
MEHDIFFDGNVKEYSWSIKTNDKVADQIREHPPAFRSGGKLDIKNNEESRFVALHVGIYWGLGVNIIKNNDVVNVMCDSKIMFEIMTGAEKIDNDIINDKVYFINQLTNLRKLKLNYQLIESKENIATKHLFGEDDTAGRDSKGYV